MPFENTRGDDHGMSFLEMNHFSLTCRYRMGSGGDSGEVQ